MLVEHGGAVGGERRNRRVDALARLRIDARRRLVEQHDARRVQNAAGEVQPPPHASGVVGDGIVGAARESDELEPARGRLARPSPLEPEHTAEEEQVLAARERRVEGRVLRHEAERTARAERIGRQRVSGNRDPSFVGVEQRREDRERRRLARAVRSEQADDLAAGDVEVYVRERRASAVSLAETFDDDRRLHATILAYPNAIRAA